MTRIKLLFTYFFLFSIFGCVQTFAAKPPVIHSYADAVALARPSVVNVYTLKARRSGSLGYLVASGVRLGAGVIMDKKGYVLTNYHVAKNSPRIVLVMSDGRKTVAKFIGGDESIDIAVLKINLKHITPIQIAKPNSVRVGDVVLAIGNPFALGHSVTQGIVSAVGRSGVGINQIETYIQTDASINPGNSGGALINTHGQLIAINTAMYSKSGGSQGIGFAIPAQIALNVMDQIIKYGKVIRGWIGVIVSSKGFHVTESATGKLHMGVVVRQLLKNSPAAKAGLKVGDVITKIDNFRTHKSTAFLHYIAQKKPGQTIVIHFVRNHQQRKLSVPIIKQPADTYLPSDELPGGRGDIPDRIEQFHQERLRQYE